MHRTTKDMHRKTKGTIGEMKIATDLIVQGYSVFVEFGDNSKIDLVAVDKNYNTIKIQVKSYASKKGAVKISPIKSGPGYRFKYQEKHADVFALYVYDRDLILYISSTELLHKKRSLTIRLEDAKNNQKILINNYKNYLNLKAALGGLYRT